MANNVSQEFIYKHLYINEMKPLREYSSVNIVLHNLSYISIYIYILLKGET